MSEDINSLLLKCLDQLGQVKEEYIRLKEEEIMSIRKDVVKVELMDIIANSYDYEDLKSKLVDYTNKLIELPVKQNDKDEEKEQDED